MNGLHVAALFVLVMCVLVAVGGLGSYRAEWARICAAHRPVAVFVPEPDYAAAHYASLPAFVDKAFSPEAFEEESCGS